MRNRLYLLFYSLSLFIFLSCSSGSSVDPLSQPDKYFVKAKVDGVDVLYDESKVKIERQYSFGIFRIIVYPTSDEYFSFTTSTANKGVVETLDIGTAFLQRSQDKPYEYAGASTKNGTCSINKIDMNKIEGTFYFDVFDNNGKGSKKISVTEGSFRVKR